MKKTTNNIDDLFREGLGGYTEVPPASVWEALDERLDNSRNKRPALYLPRTWYTVLTLLAVVSVIMALSVRWNTVVDATRTIAANYTNQASASRGGIAGPEKPTGNSHAGEDKTTAPEDKATINITTGEAHKETMTADQPKKSAGKSKRKDQPANGSTGDLSQKETTASPNKPVATATPVSQPAKLNQATDQTNTASESRNISRTPIVSTLPVNKASSVHNIKVAETDLTTSTTVAYENEEEEEEQTTFSSHSSTTKHPGYATYQRPAQTAAQVATRPVITETSNQKQAAKNDVANTPGRAAKQPEQATNAGNNTKAQQTQVATNNEKGTSRKQSAQGDNNSTQIVTTSATEQSVVSKENNVHTTNEAQKHGASNTSSAIAVTSVESNISKSVTKSTRSNNKPAPMNLTAVGASPAGKPATAISKQAKPQAVSHKNEQKTMRSTAAKATGAQHIAVQKANRPLVTTATKTTIKTPNATQKQLAAHTSNAAKSAEPAKKVSKLTATNTAKSAKGVHPTDKTSYDKKGTANVLATSYKGTLKNSGEKATNSPVAKNEKERKTTNDVTETKLVTKQRKAAVPTPNKPVVSTTSKHHSETNVPNVATEKQPVTQKDKVAVAGKYLSASAKGTKSKITSNRSKNALASKPEQTTGKDLETEEPNEFVTGTQVKKTTGKKNAVAQKIAAKQGATQAKRQPKKLVLAAAMLDEANEINIFGFALKTTPKHEEVAKKVDTAKKATPANNDAIAQSDDDNQKPTFLPGFHIGIKAGYEGGFNNSASRKMVISPYLERSLGGRLSVMAQPAIKFSSVRSQNLSGSQHYFQLRDSSVRFVDSALIALIPRPGGFDTMWRYNFIISGLKQGTSNTYATGGTYVEIELPIMLKYQINNHFSVYGGPHLTLSRYVDVKEHTKYTSAAPTGFDSVWFRPSMVRPQAPSFASVFPTGTATYSGPLYPSPQGTSIRLGFMLGFSYEINKRWMVDGLLQKAFVKPNEMGGVNVNKPLSTTYARFTIGYRLR